MRVLKYLAPRPLAAGLALVDPEANFGGACEGGLRPPGPAALLMAISR